MWRLFKVGFALSVVIALAYALSRLADEVVERPRLALPSVLGATPEAEMESDEEQVVGGIAEIEATPVSLDEAWGAFVEEFDSEKKSVMLKDTMSDWPLEQVVAFFGDALTLGLDDGEMRLAASVALERMAAMDPAAAVAAFSALLPIDKEAMAVSIAEGWTHNDPLSAWDWIESAWMSADGAVFDRSLQNQMLSTAMEAVLETHRDLPLAAALTSLTPDAELKTELAEMIAAFVVSNEPEQMMQAFEFEGDKTVDQAILDEIIREWSGRDAEGAIEWVADNGDEVSNIGAKHLAKQLIAQGFEKELQGVFASLPQVEQRDSLAAEAARVLARRDPVASANWLQGVENRSVRGGAFASALDEIGMESFDSSAAFFMLNYPEQTVERLDVATGFYLKWYKEDSEISESIFDHIRSNMSQAELHAMRFIFSPDYLSETKN